MNFAGLLSLAEKNKQNAQVQLKNSKAPVTEYGTPGKEIKAKVDVKGIQARLLQHQQRLKNQEKLTYDAKQDPQRKQDKPANAQGSKSGAQLPKLPNGLTNRPSIPASGNSLNNGASKTIAQRINSNPAIMQKSQPNEKPSRPSAGSDNNNKQPSSSRINPVATRKKLSAPPPPPPSVNYGDLLKMAAKVQADPMAPLPAATAPPVILAKPPAEKGMGRRPVNFRPSLPPPQNGSANPNCSEKSKIGQSNRPPANLSNNHLVAKLPGKPAQTASGMLEKKQTGVMPYAKNPGHSSNAPPAKMRQRAHMISKSEGSVRQQPAQNGQKGRGKPQLTARQQHQGIPRGKSAVKAPRLPAAEQNRAGPSNLQDRSGSSNLQNRAGPSNLQNRGGSSNLQNRAGPSNLQNRSAAPSNLQNRAGPSLKPAGATARPGPATGVAAKGKPVIPVAKAAGNARAPLPIRPTVPGRVIPPIYPSYPPFRPPPRKRPRPTYDDDEEEEDEEMNDFIDDDPVGGDMEDISKHIRDIFGYDRRKFTKARFEDDDDDDDLADMETGVHDQWNEEARSAYIGQLEDEIEEERERLEAERDRLRNKKLKNYGDPTGTGVHREISPDGCRLVQHFVNQFRRQFFQANANQPPQPPHLVRR